MLLASRCSAVPIVAQNGAKIVELAFFVRHRDQLDFDSDLSSSFREGTLTTLPSRQIETDAPSRARSSSIFLTASRKATSARSSIGNSIMFCGCFFMVHRSV